MGRQQASRPLQMNDDLYDIVWNQQTEFPPIHAFMDIKS